MKEEKGLVNSKLAALAKRLDSPGAIHVIVGLGLGLRLAGLAFFAHHPLVGDALLYDAFAQRLLHHEIIYPLVPPSVGYYLAFFYKFFGASPFIARASILLFYPPTAYLLHHLTKRFSNRTGANLAVLIFAFYPLYLLLSLEPITEPPCVALLLLAIVLTFRAVESGSWMNFLLLGIDIGLLCLTRPSTLPFLVCIPVYLWWKTRKVARSLLPAFLGVLLVGIWVLNLYRNTGHFVMINYSSSQNVFLGNNQYTPLYRTWWFAVRRPAGAVNPAFLKLYGEITKNPWYVQDKIFRRMAIDYVLSRPDLFVVRTLSRLRSYFAFDTYSGSFLLNRYYLGPLPSFTAMGLDGIFYCFVMIMFIIRLTTLTRESKHLESILIALGFALLYAAPYWLSVSDPIYHFPIIPLFGALAAAMLADLLEKPSGEVWSVIRSSRTRKYVLCISLLLFIYIQVEYAVIMILYSQY